MIVHPLPISPASPRCYAAAAAEAASRSHVRVRVRVCVGGWVDARVRLCARALDACCVQAWRACAGNEQAKRRGAAHRRICERPLAPMSSGHVHKPGRTGPLALPSRMMVVRVPIHG
jgi:hypothetical protein